MAISNDQLDWIRIATATCADGDRTVFANFTPEETALLLDDLVPGEPPPPADLDEETLENFSSQQRFTQLHLDKNTFNGKNGFICAADLGDQANFAQAKAVKNRCEEVLARGQTSAIDDNEKRCAALADAFERRSLDPSNLAWIWRKVRGGVVALPSLWALFGPTLGVYRWFDIGRSVPGTDNVFKRGLCRSAGIGPSEQLFSAPLSIDLSPSVRDGQTCLAKGTKEAYIIATDEAGNEVLFNDEEVQLFRNAFFNGAGHYAVHKSETWQNGVGRICLQDQGNTENGRLRGEINELCESEVLKGRPNAAEKCDAVSKALRTISEEHGFITWADGVSAFLGGLLVFGPGHTVWRAIETSIARKICINTPQAPAPQPAPVAEVSMLDSAWLSLSAGAEVVADKLANVNYEAGAKAILWGIAAGCGATATAASGAGTGIAVVCPFDLVAGDVAMGSLTVLAAGATVTAGGYATYNAQLFLRSFF